MLISENVGLFEIHEEEFDIFPLTQLIGCLMKEERYQEAENIIKKYISKDKNGYIHYYLGLVHAHQKKIDEALNDFKEALAKNPENKPVKMLATKLLIYQANFRISNKDWEGACSALSLALELKPEDRKIQEEFTQFKNILPVSNLKANRRKEAAEIWEEEQKNDPMNFRITHSLALLFHWWAINEEKKITDKEDTLFLDSLWMKAIANWVMLKNNENFWKEWKEERERSCSKEGDILLIKDEDLNELRNRLPIQLDKRFRDYADHYNQENMKEHVERHVRYQTALELELKSTSYFNKVVEIIKDKTDCSIHYVCGVMMSRQLDIISDIDKILDQASKISTENETVEMLKICYSPLGPIYILMEKKKLIEAIHEFETLPEEICESKEGKNVISRVYLKRGEEIMTLNNDIKESLNCWKDGLKYAEDHDIKEQYEKTISNACIEQAKKLNKQGKFDEAIEILEDGEMLVNDISIKESVREYLAVSYCDRGEKYLQNNLYKAEKDLKKALEYNGNYNRAKEFLSIVYNNQGLSESNVDKEIEKLEKAYRLFSTETVTNNLANAYLKKGNNIVEWDRYSAKRYVIKAMEINPSNPEIRKIIQEILSNMRY